MVWFIQPYWELANIPLAYFGILWALLQFNIAFWAVMSHKFKEKSYSRLLIIFTILQITAYIFLAFNVSIIGVFVIFIFGALRGLNKPMYVNFINHRTPSHMRATVLSVESMISSLTFSIIAPFMGYISDIYSMQTAFLVSATTITILGFIFWMLFASTVKRSNASN